MDSGALFQRKKRKVYVSYDHHADARYYDRFQRLFSTRYLLSRDASLEREIGADDAEAFVRQLDRGPMRDSACTVVLLGARTHLDKFVDWEIKTALDQGDGLLGIVLPENAAQADGEPTLPERFRRNFETGFAVLVRWSEVAGEKIDLTGRILFALDRPASAIDNSLPLKA
jgi:hypothetical protein